MLRIRRLLAPLALLGIAAAHPVAADTDIANMTPAERSAFGAEVRAYLLKNPEVLYEVIDVMAERREEAQAAADREIVAANAEAIFDDGYSWETGNPEGDVTVVEFLDYNCPYCRQAHPQVMQMLEDDPNVRLVVKEYPILGPESVEAARVALAAVERDADKFAPFYEAMMAYQGKVTSEVAHRLAEAAGYDADALEEAAAEPEIVERLQRNYALADQLGIEGTPGFVIGGKVIRGYVDAAEMAAAVEAARSSTASN